MGKFSREEILAQIETYDVRYIRLQFTDMLGMIKSVEVPSQKILKVLDNEQMFDGSSVEGFVRIHEADMFLYPDLDTWLILTWEVIKEGCVARLICDVYDIHKKPFEADPKAILKKQLNNMKESGFSTFNVGVEPEFFLFKKDENNTKGYALSDKGGYFDLSPTDASEDIRRDIVLELQKLGFVIEASHHEVAYGQHKINFQFENALEACDNIQTFKWVVKTIAKRHEYHATFMAKPVENINGSGMHVNCSLFNHDKGNMFYDPNTKDQLSILAHEFIAGVLIKAKEMVLITNPTVNSYKRLIPGYEAPCYVSWSLSNRSTMIRIPASRKQATRIEARFVDPMANPYLAVSMILAAGLKGIQNHEKVAPVEKNLFSLTSHERMQLSIDNLPKNLG